LWCGISQHIGLFDLRRADGANARRWWGHSTDLFASWL
jgi:hypothetical protein